MMTTTNGSENLETEAARDLLARAGGDLVKAREMLEPELDEGMGIANWFGILSPEEEQTVRADVRTRLDDALVRAAAQ